MIKNIVRGLILFLFIALLVPIFLFVPKQNSVNAFESKKLKYEVVFDRTDKSTLIDLSNHEIEFEIGKDVFKENGTTIINGSTFADRTKTKIKYEGDSATIISETNQVKIQNEEKNILIDEVGTQALLKKSVVKSNECEFAFEDVAEALGYNIEKQNSKYILTREFFTKRLIVKSNSKVNDETAIAMAKFDGEYILTYATEKETKLAYEKFEKSETVEYVYADGVFTFDDIVTDYASTQSNYDFYSWGATVMGVEKYRNQVEKYGQLNEVVVAVLDTGIDNTHPMFEDRLVTEGYNSVMYHNDGSNPNYGDQLGHGTHVAGIICDLTPRNVKILPVKVSLQGVTGYKYDVLTAFKLVVEESDSRLKAINMSFSSATKIGSQYHTNFTNAVNSAKNKGISSVAASGNYHNDASTRCPANIANVITTGSVGMSNNILFHADSSNYGDYLDFSAPGVGILSARTGGGTVVSSGTSMATPHLCAAIALMCSNPNKSYSPDQIEKELRLTCLDWSVIGKDTFYGHGIINVQHIYATIFEDSLNFVQSNKQADGSFTLTMESTLPNSNIYYTTDMSYPSIDSEQYTSPIVITNSTVVRAVAYVTNSSGEIIQASEIESAAYQTNNLNIGEFLDVTRYGDIEKYYGPFANIEIPSTVNGIQVKTVSADAFSYTYVEQVVLPDSIKTIADSSFVNCPNLEKLVGNGVTSIGFQSFYNSSKLKTLELNNVKVIGDFAFVSDLSLNSSLTTLNLPNLEVVGKLAFANNVNLAVLNAEKLTHIANEAFYGCAIEVLNLPNVNVIGDQSFALNSDLKSLNAPNVEHIGVNSFNGLENLETININNVQFIGEGAFRLCNKLEVSLDVPNLEFVGAFAFQDVAVKLLKANKLNTVLEFAFSNCDLKQIEIPEIEYIGNSAFNNNDALEIVTLSNNVSYMGDLCFTNKECLYRIHFNTIAKDYLEANTLTNYQNISTDNNILFYEVENEKVSILGFNSDIMPDDYKIPAIINNMPVVRICKNAFKNCENISTINLPYLEIIEESAFANCEKLTTIKLDKATVIQNEAFLNCSSLSSVELSEIISIGDYAFFNCENLKSLALPGFESYVGNYSLGFKQQDSSVVKVENFKLTVYAGTPGENYATCNDIDYEFIHIIRGMVFYYSTFIAANGEQQVMLASVYSTFIGELSLPSSLNNGKVITKVGQEALKNNTFITRLYIPSSITTIEESAFEGCSMLQEVYAEELLNVKACAFKNCQSLRYVYAPKLETIDECAFENCVNLETITTNALLSLGSDGGDDDNDGGSSFAGCYKLKEIYLPKVQAIFGECFSNSLEKAYFKNSLVVYNTKVVPSSTKVYGYNYNSLQDALSNNEFETLDPNFKVLLDIQNVSFKINREGDVYLNATSNGQNVIYQWYIQSETNTFEPIYTENYSEILLKDFGYNDYKLKVLAMNWDGTITESTSVAIALRNDDIVISDIANETDGFGEVIISKKVTKPNEIANVTIVPKEHYEVEKIFVNGEEIEPKEDFNLNKCNENRTIKIQFQKKKFMIDVIQPSYGGTILIDGDLSDLVVESGMNSATFKFVPNEGYHLKSVIIDGEIISTNINEFNNDGYVFTNVKANHTISAEFEINIYNIVLQTKGLTSNQIFEEKVEHGDDWSFDLLLEWNSQIKSVKIDNEFIALTNLSNNILNISNITKNLNVVVEYEIYIFEITFNDYKNGLVEIEYIQSLSNQTQEFKLSFIPEWGYQVYKFVLDGKDVSHKVVNDEITVTISKSVNAKVEFNKKKLTVSIVQPDNGKISNQKNVSSYEIDFANDSVVYYFTPNEGYLLESIIVNNEKIDVDIQQVAVNGYIFKNIQEDYLISAIFAIKKFNILTESEGPGTVSVSAESVNYGEDLIVDLITLNHADILAVYVNNQKLESLKPQYIIEDIKEDILIKAVFAPKLHIINVSQNEGGIVTPNGVFEVEEGQSVKFEIIPNKGYVLKDFKLNGQSVHVDGGYILEHVSSRNDIEVMFERIELILTVTCGDNGTITPQGEIGVKYGDSKLLQIKPNDGYGISRITINNAEAPINKNIVLNDITKNTLVHVEFAKMYLIKTISNFGGTITESSTVYGGESKEIKIQPNVGFKIKDVVIDGESVGSINTYKFQNINIEHTLEVQFEQIMFKITFNINGEGEIVCDESLSAVAYGDSRTIHIEPKGRYKLPETIMVDGKETEIANGIIILKNITKDVSIEIKMIKGEKEKVNILPIVLIITASLLIAGGAAVTVVLIVRHKKKKNTDDLSVNQENKSPESVNNSVVGDNNMRPKVLQRNNVMQSTTNHQTGPNQTTGVKTQTSVQNGNQQPTQMRNSITNSAVPTSIRPNPVNLQSRPMAPQQRPMTPQQRPMAPQSRPIANPQGRPIVNSQQRPINNLQNAQQVRPQAPVGHTGGIMKQPSQMVRPQQHQTGANLISQKTVNQGPQPQRVVQPYTQSNLNQGLQNGNISTANNHNSNNINKTINNPQFARNSTENPQDKK